MSFFSPDVIAKEQLLGCVGAPVTVPAPPAPEVSIIGARMSTVSRKHLTYANLPVMIGEMLTVIARRRRRARG